MNTSQITKTCTKKYQLIVFFINHLNQSVNFACANAVKYRSCYDLTIVLFVAQK